VSTGHALTQTNQTLELTHSDFIRRTALTILLVLSHSFEFLFEHMGRLLGEARLDSASKLDIGLHLLS
jgi:hypothetical protein